MEFLVFSPCEEFLVFLSVFPFFSRDFSGSVGIKNPCFLGGFPGHFPKKQGKEGQGYGVVSEGVFAESLRGNSAESSRKLRFIAPGKGAEILRKFAENFLQSERPHK